LINNNQIRKFINETINETDIEGVPFLQRTPAADADGLYKALKKVTKSKPSRLGRGGNTGLGWGLMKTQMALPRNRRGGGSGHPVSNIPSFMMSRKKGWTDEKLKEGKLTEKVTGKYKVSPDVQMHWGMDKVVIISGNKRVVLTRKELANIVAAAKRHRLTR
jgi:hypothetical protein